MRSIAVTMFSIGIALVLTSPFSWLMSRIYRASAPNDPAFQRLRAIAERMVMPLLLAGLITLAISGVALLLTVATD
jgi:hypothetical protein